MITEIKIEKPIRKLFKAGEAYSIRPLTFIVGDNGSGKTTLLQELKEAIQKYDCRLKYVVDKSGIERFLFVDFEKDNPRTLNDKSRVSFFSIYSRYMSHGETNMNTFVNGFAELKNTLFIFDEPDQALSIRSCYRLFEIFQKLLENGCQIIAAIHSQTMMEMVPEVLSAEHKRWMKTGYFLRSQKTRKKLKVVDHFEKNVRYRVKFKVANSNTACYLGKAVGNVIDSCSRAKEYRKKEIAEKAAIKEMEQNKKQLLKESEFFVKHGFFKILESYEIEQFELTRGNDEW